MAKVQPGRWSAEVEDGTVVFLIGMRVNRLTRPWRWLPAAVAMTRMLAELQRAPDLGLLGVSQYVSGRTILGVQYWRSWDHLNAYSRGVEQLHLPAWRAFNRQARRSSAVGVFHETYVTHDGQNEAVFVNMPRSGVALATASVPVQARGNSAAHRLDASQPDVLTDA
jgi:hypothetical protein